jgi:hypothetical protein
MTLEPRYAWLGREPGPHMLLQMLALTGVHEFSEGADNQVILAWAKELGFKGYTHDSMSRLIAARRAPWRLVQPPNIGRRFMTASGTAQGSEA